MGMLAIVGVARGEISERDLDAKLSVAMEARRNVRSSGT